MGSERLPGKVLEKVGGKTVLHRLLERLKACKMLDGVVVATSRAPEDKAIREEARNRGVYAVAPDCPVDDVLTRFELVSMGFLPNLIARFTADSPLMDPWIVDDVVSQIGTHDAVRNLRYPPGMDVEAFTPDTLKKLSVLCTDQRREHVTLYMYQNMDKFDVFEVLNPEDNSEIILCVDYPEDLERARQIVRWDEHASCGEIVREIRESETHGVPPFKGSPALSN
jgi:spore coat polysaccharide biosynthesis protein SpsF